MFATHPVNGSLGRCATKRADGNVGVLEVFQRQRRYETNAKPCAHHAHHSCKLFGLHQLMEWGRKMLVGPLVYRLPNTGAGSHLDEWFVGQGGCLNR